MKKLFTMMLFLCCLSISAKVFALNEFNKAEFLKAMKAAMQESIKGYQDLGNCKQPKNQLGFKIYGIENGKCHYAEGPKDCYASMSSMKAFSSKMIKQANDMILEMDKGRLSMQGSNDVFGDSIIQGGVCK